MNLRILCIAETVSLAHLGRMISFVELFVDHTNKNSSTKMDITFACSEDMKSFLPEKYSFHPVNCLNSKVFFSRLSLGTPAYRIDELHAEVEEDLVLIEKLKPHLIIGDFRLSLQISARIKKVPFLNITSAHWSPDVDLKIPFPENRIFRFLGSNISKGLFHYIIPYYLIRRTLIYHADNINKLRTQYGLPVLPDIRHIYVEGDWVLFADPEGFIPLKKKPKNGIFLGPLLWQPKSNCDQTILLPTKESSLPQIYLTLGSSGNYQFFGDLIECLENYSCKVWIATSHTNEQISRGNLIIAPYLPANQIIKNCDLVICNGGSGTAYQALALGVPVFGLVSNMDQAWTMSLIEERKMGLSLRYWEFSKKRFLKRLLLLLTTPCYRENAKNYSSEFALNPIESFSKLENIFEEIKLKNT